MEKGSDRDESVEDLFSRLYDELREVSRRLMQHERPDHPLRPTALVNEAFLSMRDSSSLRWNDDAHFQAIVALNMRRILQSHGRRKSALKRQPTLDALADDAPAAANTEAEIREVHRALDSLPHRHRDGAYYRQLLLWKDVFGLTQREVGDLIHRTEQTVREHLTLARICLGRALDDG